jgi:hypothetical protein
MYQDLKKIYWWMRMKVDIVKLVASCRIYQCVKAEHKSPAGKLQSLEVPIWSWDDIAMDFVIGLPRSPKGRDAIWVVINHLSKVVYFIPIRSNSSASDLAPIYMREIVRLHGVPRTIVSDGDAKFISKLWSSLQEALDTTLRMSTAFRPQTDEQVERTIQTLEDKLRSCVLSWKGSCEEHLPLVEFSYNDSYHSSIRCALTRLFTERSIIHHFVGMQSVKGQFWVQIGFNNQLSVLLKFKNTC